MPSKRRDAFSRSTANSHRDRSPDRHFQRASLWIRTVPVIAEPILCQHDNNYKKDREWDMMEAERGTVCVLRVLQN